jgi:hypothetical protein
MRVWEKHQIRRYLHPQLKKLWETHPLLSFYTQAKHWQKTGGFTSSADHSYTKIENIATHFEGYVPLVHKDWGMACELEILFLRAEPVGNILQRGGAGGGDIDNRIKTLFDALCIPVRAQVKLKENDAPDPSPMYVLLEDDSLITSIKINADRFLASADDADPSDVLLVASVNIKAANPTQLPYGVPL